MDAITNWIVQLQYQIYQLILLSMRQRWDGASSMMKGGEDDDGDCADVGGG